MLASLLGWSLVAFVASIALSKGVRHITSPDGTEIEETWDSGPVVPWAVGGSLAILGTLGAVAFFGGAGGMAAIIGGGAKTAGTGVAAVIGAPNTPTVDAAVVDTSTWYVQFSAFVGSGSDTQDSIHIQVDRLGGNFSSPLTDVKSGVQLIDTLSDNTDWKSDSVYVVRGRQKGVAGGWSAYDSVQVTNTVATSDFLSRLPVGWADTVLYDPMSTAAASKVTNGDPWGTINGWAYTLSGGSSGIPGGRLTAHPDSLVRDSFTVAGAMSAPYSWESSYKASLSGTGPDKWVRSFSAKSRLFISVVAMFESPSSPVGAPGAQTWVWNNAGSKFVDIAIGGSHYRWDWYAGAITFGVGGTNVTDPVTGCTASSGHGLVANNMAPDTLTGVSLPCRNKGRFVPVYGTWEEWWICFDLSGSTETISFGKGSTIAGYHTGIASMGTGIDTFELISTLGGGSTGNPAQSRWVDHVSLIAGSSGSCPSP